MSDPRFARPDLCSIRAATEHTGTAGAGRGGFSADGYPLGDDDPPALPASGTDRALCLSAAAAVLAVAGIAAYVCYGHAYAVIRAHGETGITALLEPATIGGLLYASSLLILYAARHGSPVPGLARWLPRLAIAATLTANAAQGWSHGPVGVVIAAWPAVSLAGSYEILIWLIRTCGTAGRGPSAGPACTGQACRAVVRAAPAAAADDERSGRIASGQMREPQGQAWGQRASHPAGQRQDEGPDAGAVNDAAVAAYRLSVQAGNPLSERRLAQIFGRTSRRWARARIAEARQASPPPDSPTAMLTANP
jgi:hypothetical protein